MDETTKIILTSVLTSLVTFLGGQPLWNFVTERMKRNTPTLQELTEVDNSNARVALEIVGSLRVDLERAQKALEAKQSEFEADLAKLRQENDTHIKELREFYEGRMETLKREYEARILLLHDEYEGRLQRSEEEADSLRKRLVILEDERQLLLKLSDAFEKAKKAGTISGD